LVAKTDSPSSSAANREEAVLLADALAELPDQYREIIVARHFEGLRFEEIANEREQTVDSVKAMWRRGIGRLRELLIDGRK
jgi:RNA polymerase sigma-70 factor (ECF subfamily)